MFSSNQRIRRVKFEFKCRLQSDQNEMEGNVHDNIGERRRFLKTQKI